MPNYDYECIYCGLIQTDFRKYEDRLVPSKCLKCNKDMLYQFPIDAAKNFQSFDPYFDESLNCDIHGRRERKQAMQHFRVIEAGDPVNGKRNIETSSHAIRVEPKGIQGIRLSDFQRRQELGRKAKEEFRIGVVEKESKRTVTPTRAITELPSAMKGKKKVRLFV